MTNLTGVPSSKPSTDPNHNEDSTNLAEVFERLRPRMVRLISRVIGSRDAEDVAQEVWIRVLGRNHNDIRILEPYLMKAAKNLALDHHRTQMRHPRHDDIDDEVIPDGIADSETNLIAQQELGGVAYALAELPLRCRQVVRLSRIEGWSNRRIAKYLSVSERTVHNDLKQALAACRNAVERDE